MNVSRGLPVWIVPSTLILFVALDARGHTPQATRHGSASGREASAAGSRPVELVHFEFETVAVDPNGAIASRRKGEARSYAETIHGVRLEMVEIPGGAFVMGSSELPSQQPSHEVRVPAFYMGTFEVTQAQWRAVARLPKVHRDLRLRPSHFTGDDLPVEQVSRDDALEFCARLSKATGRAYRLPTEAEWEYACRAGTTTAFAFGETITAMVANYDGTYPFGSGPRGVDRERTIPVGSLGVANAFGLYDVHGNVAEWCFEDWHGDYTSAPADGSAWTEGGQEGLGIHRGGSWFSGAFVARAAHRGAEDARARTNDVGFRVAASAPVR
jgi:formylglycine-generating enzyme required for sulfatase activity